MFVNSFVKRQEAANPEVNLERLALEVDAERMCGDGQLATQSHLYYPYWLVSGD